MTKKGWSIVLLFFLALSGGIGVGYFTSGGTEDSDIIAAEEYGEQDYGNKYEDFVIPKEENKEVSSAGKEKYMISLSDNRLFIYKISEDGSMEIIEDKEVDTASLNSDDYGTLFKGIIFDTLTEAREILEDYVN
ncbi:MAG: BofC C-terminal domain-containing protein [Clostridia bacterium]|nr:BofC C-terminal domain-containing protein [Clostridia bacterium]